MIRVDLLRGRREHRAMRRRATLSATCLLWIALLDGMHGPSIGWLVTVPAGALGAATFWALRRSA